MKLFFTILCSVFLLVQIASAQFKPHLEQRKPTSAVSSPTFTPIYNPVSVASARRNLWAGGSSALQPITFPALEETLTIVRNEQGMPIYIEGIPRRANQVGKTIDQQVWSYLDALKNTLKIHSPQDELDIQAIEKDELGQVHVKLQQYIQGVKVYGAEIWLHQNQQQIELMNGYLYPSPQLQNMLPTLTEQQAIAQAQASVSKLYNIKDLSQNELQVLGKSPIQAELVVFHLNRDLDAEQLAWMVTIVPHLGHEFLIFVNARTGTILQQFDQVCRLHEHLSPPDGPKKAQARDLFNINQTVDVYEFQGGFYMLDASRAGMFDSRRSKIPNNPVGAIWTIDAQNNSPSNDNFEAAHIFSSNNSWSNQKAVSAHYNAGKAYEYFLSKFSRNSINGQGGNIVSFINVTEDDGSAMDNAFWHGTAMFYGNGDRAFSAPLAKSLDVAGHEISHGVVQNSANLEYFGESGALNESFADVFGVLIDRDDFKLGEDVVNTSIYRSGALRDMANPNNGGTSLSSPGYQPANITQQYRGTEDNGGVHINSGIPNKAFHLMATTIGKDKTEKIYYRALTNYLVRSSKFVDMRLAIVRAAMDLHGANSAEVKSANDAFDGVGIKIQNTGGGNGGNTTTTTVCDLESNPGTPLVLLTNENNSAIYSANGQGSLIGNPLIDIEILSKPSCTDNGSFCVFVGADKTLYGIDFNARKFEQLENQPIWRNAAISKEGEKIALLTDELSNQIIIFDFVSGQQTQFDLYKPTTAQGVSTGDVQYADVMEWDYNGEYLIYDAFNELNSSFGENLNYWDISFLRAWDNQSNSFGDGLILSLFTGLPENVSVGNPTLAKNSACVLAIDYLDEFENTYQVVGLNFETGESDIISENNTLGSPNYATDDEGIIFDFLNNGTEQLLAYRELADNKISPKNDDILIFVEGGSRGTWITTGERSFTALTDLPSSSIQVFPTLTDDKINIIFEDKTNQALIQVYNSLGQLQLQQQSKTLNTLLSLASLSAGTYWVSIQIQNEVIYKTVIKQ